MSRFGIHLNILLEMELVIGIVLQRHTFNVFPASYVEASAQGVKGIIQICGSEDEVSIKNESQLKCLLPAVQLCFIQTAKMHRVKPANRLTKEQALIFGSTGHTKSIHFREYACKEGT